MSVRAVRAGDARFPREGLRIGTVRHPPRGVRKADYARRNYFDLWLPELSPSAELVHWYLSSEPSDARWQRFAKSYRREMQAPECQRLIDLLAAFSRAADFSIACYCEHEDRCHRSILRELLAEHGARIAVAKLRSSRSTK